MRDEPKNVRANLVQNVTANFPIFYRGLTFDIKAVHWQPLRERTKSLLARASGLSLGELTAAVVHR